MSRPFSRALPHCFLVSLVLAAPARASGDGPTFRLVDEMPHRASVTGASVGPKTAAGPADAFLLPMFRVDRSRADGETTLFALRNVTDESQVATVRYRLDHEFDPSAPPDLVQTFVLAPHEVTTVNLRDLPEISAASFRDRVARGWVQIDHEEGVGDVFSSDWFRINPGQNAASGGRMVDVDHTGMCTVWDLRYLVGGSFDGSTQLELFVANPLGGDADTDVPSYTIGFYDEKGALQGAFQVFEPRQVEEIDVRALLALVPGGAEPVGALEIAFAPGTDGGLVSATYGAGGRYSVGMNATCLTP